MAVKLKNSKSFKSLKEDAILITIYYIHGVHMTNIQKLSDFRS